MKIYYRVLIYIGLMLLSFQLVAAQDTSATPSDSDVLDQAAQVANDAMTQGENAKSVVLNADNAVNTTNNLLGIVVGALAIGGILVVAIGVLGFRALFNTLSEMRGDLEKTRGEIDEMLTGLRNNAQGMRIQSQNATQALSYMQLGEQQLERGNYTSALQLYQQAHQLDPNNQATNYFLGELYLQTNDIKNGMEYLERALETDYAPAEAALGRALMLLADQASNVGEKDLLYAQAERRLLKALQIDPTSLNMHGRPVQGDLADLYQHEGRTDKADEHREIARKISPKSA